MYRWQEELFPSALSYLGIKSPFRKMIPKDLHRRTKNRDYIGTKKRGHSFFFWERRKIFKYKVACGYLFLFRYSLFVSVKKCHHKKGGSAKKIKGRCYVGQRLHGAMTKVKIERKCLFEIGYNTLRQSFL